MRIEVRDDLEVFTELSDWWNSCPGPSQNVYLTTEWFQALAANVLLKEDRLQVLLVFDGDQPKAALPLFRRDRRLRSLSELSTESFDFVSDPDLVGAAFLVDYLKSSTFVRLEAVNSDSLLVSAVDSIESWRVDKRTESAYIDLSHGPEELMQSFSKNMRSNLRRASRALDELGEVAVVRHPQPSQVMEVLDQGFRLEKAGWKGEQGLSVLDSDRRYRFFLELAASAERRDWLRLGVLYLDGRMVAFNYDLQYSNRMSGLITSYDDTLPPRCSPGNVLLWRTLETAAEEGIQGYELGGVGGSNVWKLQWTHHTTPRAYVTCFGMNIGGKLGYAAWRSREAVRNFSKPAEP